MIRVPSRLAPWEGIVVPDGQLEIALIRCRDSLSFGTIGRECTRGSSRLRKPRRSRYCAPAIGVLLALVLVEVAARLFLPTPPTPRRTDPPNAPQIYPLGGRMYVYEPHSEFAHVYDPRFDSRGYLGPDGRIEYRINSAGLRGPEFSPVRPPDVRRLLLLGDSVTFGEGVRYPDTMGARIGTVLEDAWSPQRIEVINAGVQGFDTEQEVALYHSLRGREPDTVVLVFFLNDAMESSETIRWQERTTGVEPSGLARVSRAWQLWAGSRRQSQGQARYLNSLRESLRPGPGWDTCRSSLREFAGATQADGVRGIVAIFPLLWRLDATYPFEDVHEQIVALCHESDCEVIDLLDSFRGQVATDLWVHPTDPHPNEVAHRIAAEAIVSQILSR